MYFNLRLLNAVPCLAHQIHKRHFDKLYIYFYIVTLYGHDGGIGSITLCSMPFFQCVLMTKYYGTTRTMKILIIVNVCKKDLCATQLKLHFKKKGF